MDEEYTKKKIQEWATFGKQILFHHEIEWEQVSSEEFPSFTSTTNDEFVPNQEYRSSSMISRCESIDGFRHRLERLLRLCVETQKAHEIYSNIYLYTTFIAYIVLIVLTGIIGNAVKSTESIVHMTVFAFLFVYFVIPKLMFFLEKNANAFRSHKIKDCFFHGIITKLERLQKETTNISMLYRHPIVVEKYTDIFNRFQKHEDTRDFNWLELFLQKRYITQE
jgi:hypothetical protein